MAETRKVYLDHSATTPIDRRVVDAMLPYLYEKFGNASSVHFFGQEARAAVDRARREVAALIGARPNEIVFVSGGTEANNLAIRGITDASNKRHLITSTIEHPSVRGICDELEKQGWEITRLPAYEDGIVRYFIWCSFQRFTATKLPCCLGRAASCLTRCYCSAC